VTDGNTTAAPEPSYNVAESDLNKAAELSCNLDESGLVTAATELSYSPAGHAIVSPPKVFFFFFISHLKLVAVFTAA
jgi:hypothetical protein